MSQVKKNAKETHLPRLFSASFFVVGMKCSSIGGTVEDPLEANLEDTSVKPKVVSSSSSSLGLGLRNKKKIEVLPRRKVEKGTTW